MGKDDCCAISAHSYAKKHRLAWGWPEVAGISLKAQVELSYFLDLPISGGHKKRIAAMTNRLHDAIGLRLLQIGWLRPGALLGRHRVCRLEKGDQVAPCLGVLDARKSHVITGDKFRRTPQPCIERFLIPFHVRML